MCLYFDCYHFILHFILKLLFNIIFLAFVQKNVKFGNCKKKQLTGWCIFCIKNEKTWPFLIQSISLCKSKLFIQWSNSAICCSKSILTPQSAVPGIKPVHFQKENL